MDIHIEKLRQMLMAENGEGLKGVLQSAYELCQDRGYARDEVFRKEYEELESCTAFLAYPQRNAIECAVNALCAEYDRLAFAEGFQMGARMILELLTVENG